MSKLRRANLVTAVIAYGTVHFGHILFGIFLAKCFIVVLPQVELAVPGRSGSCRRHSHADIFLTSAGGGIGGSIIGGTAQEFNGAAPYTVGSILFTLPSHADILKTCRESNL